jgi:hypothetical protein
MMTNAPFMLNVDCDMYANNPQVVLHAMCLLLGSKDEKESGFVQFPQCFYDGLKDDPFGNQLIALIKVSKLLQFLSFCLFSFGSRQKSQNPEISFLLVKFSLLIILFV